MTTALAVLLSYEWFAADPRRGELYTLLLPSALGAVLLAGATDLMEMVLGILLSSATGYVLASYHRRSARAAEAAMTYYLLGALATGLAEGEGASHEDAERDDEEHFNLASRDDRRGYQRSS